MPTVEEDVMPTVEELVSEFGYTQEEAEKEVRRASCEHDYGDRCMSSFLGCYRTCLKCGQMMGLGRHCAGAGTTSAKPTEDG